MGHHSVSAGAVVIREDGLFLVVQRRDTGAWVTPGGVLEPGEPLRDGAAREVYEETGVTTEVGRLVGVYQNLSTDVVTFVFRARPVNSQHAHTSDETLRVQWITPTQADDLMTRPFAARVRDAFDDNPPVIRTLAEPRIMAPKAPVTSAEESRGTRILGQRGPTERGD